MRRLLASASALTLAASSAGAVPFAFEAITASGVEVNGGLTTAEIGASQLSMDVTEAGGNQALFTFINSGPYASSITDIYFHNPSLLQNASISGSSPGVQFSLGASPASLPGRNNVAPRFENDVALNTSSGRGRPGVNQRGVNPGEQVGILVDLQSGQTFSEVLDGLNSGTLRVGLHVGGFQNGRSQSFVNLPSSVPSPVPEPSTALALGTFALVGFAFVHWNRGRAV